MSHPPLFPRFWHCSCSRVLGVILPLSAAKSTDEDNSVNLTSQLSMPGNHRSPLTRRSELCLGPQPRPSLHQEGRVYEVKTQPHLQSVSSLMVETAPAPKGDSARQGEAQTLFSGIAQFYMDRPRMYEWGPGNFDFKNFLK